MTGRISPALSLLGLAALVSISARAAGQEIRAFRVPLPEAGARLESLPAPDPRLVELLPLLDGQDPVRIRELEARYDEAGNSEKRLLERYFGVIEHRYRVDADPRGIYQQWPAAGVPSQALVVALEEIVAGRYSAYYFFDGVIRPNVFASEGKLARTDSALHEKIHLVQPSIYRALGIPCAWRDPRDPCVSSLEPVAVYLTEFAVLKRQSPGRPDASINRTVARHLAAEATRCGYGKPIPRCPATERVPEYFILPLQLSEEVSRHGVKEGIRRFVGSLATPALASGCAEPCGS